MPPWYRRNPHDRLVIRQLEPNEFFVMRPAPNGSVEFRPYDHPLLFAGVKAVLKNAERKVTAPLQFNKRQLPRIKERGKAWEAYLSPYIMRELRRLAAPRHPKYPSYGFA